MKLITNRILFIIEDKKMKGDIRFYSDVYKPIGMSRGLFNNIKSGTHNFTVEDVYNFCHVFNVDFNELFKKDFSTQFLHKNTTVTTIRKINNN